MFVDYDLKIFITYGFYQMIQFCGKNKSSTNSNLVFVAFVSLSVPGREECSHRCTRVENTGGGGM